MGLPPLNTGDVITASLIKNTSMSKSRVYWLLLLSLSLVPLGAFAIATQNKGVAPPMAGPQDSLRNNIAGLTYAIESGRFHGKRLAGLYKFRGILRSDMMELESALVDLAKAIALESKNPENYLQLATVLYRLRRDDEALSALAKAERLSPRSSMLYMQRGYLHYYRQQYQAALKDFESAWRLNVKDAYALLWIFIAAEKERGQGRQALEKKRSDAMLDEWPGELIKLYKGDLSATQFESNLRQTQPSPWQVCEARFYLGQYYALHGERDAALQQFQLAHAMQQVEFTEHHLAKRELAAWVGGL